MASRPKCAPTDTDRLKSEQNFLRLSIPAVTRFQRGGCLGPVLLLSMTDAQWENGTQNQSRPRLDRFRIGHRGFGCHDSSGITEDSPRADNDGPSRRDLIRRRPTKRFI